MVCSPRQEELSIQDRTIPAQKKGAKTNSTPSFDLPSFPLTTSKDNSTGTVISQERGQKKNRKYQQQRQRIHMANLQQRIQMPRYEALADSLQGL